MKVLLFYLSVAIILFHSCGKKCSNDKPIIELESTIISYFGMYKPNNWWIYENTNKTKKDSIFVTDYDEGSYCDDPVLDESRRFRRFRVNSKFLTTRVDNSFAASIGVDNVNLFANLRLTPNNKFVNAVESVLVKQPELIDSVKLSNTQIFQNVVKIYSDPTYPEVPFALIAPKIGVIRFVNSGDTFNLKTFKIN